MGYTLAHHGIKGQRWGVRRFQNQDGSLTDAGRNRARIKKTEKDVDRIIDSLTAQERHFVGIEQDRSYSSYVKADKVIKRFMAKHGNEPIGFLDIDSVGKDVEITIEVCQARNGLF